MSLRCTLGWHDYTVRYATREIKCTRCQTHDHMAELARLRYEEVLRELVNSGEFSATEAQDEIQQYWHDYEAR